jgi:hypothetical protein
MRDQIYVLQGYIDRRRQVRSIPIQRKKSEADVSDGRRHDLFIYLGQLPGSIYVPTQTSQNILLLNLPTCSCRIPRDLWHLCAPKHPNFLQGI